MTAKATQDEYIFRWGADSDPAAVARLRKTLQATVIERTPGWGFELWRCENPAAETLLAARLKDGGPPGLCSLLECIQANISVTASDFAADPGAQRLWGMHNTGQTGGVADADIDLPEAWDRSRGTGTLVAVLDTGVDYRHADLADNIWVNQAEIPGNGLDDDGNGYVDDVHGYDFAYNDGDPMDRHGHGTHVAGTIAAAADNGTGVAGVAPEAQIMALKFLDDSGTGSLFDAIQALDYAVMMGAQLSNNSWGGGQYHSALAEALALAADAGHLAVAAAGNTGTDIDSDPHYPASYSSEALISVAASDDSDRLAGFSNYGLSGVDVVAPGEAIYSTLPGDSYGSPQRHLHGRPPCHRHRRSVAGRRPTTSARRDPRPADRKLRPGGCACRALSQWRSGQRRCGAGGGPAGRPRRTHH